MPSCLSTSYSVKGGDVGVHCTISFEFILSLPIESINLFFILYFISWSPECFSAIFLCVFFRCLSFAESREMLLEITFDLMETENFNGVVVGCGDASNDIYYYFILFFLEILAFVRPVDSQSLRKNVFGKQQKS